MMTFARRLFDMLRRHMREARARRAEVLSVRALDSLPESLRRDIGWPDRYAGLAVDDEWSTPIDLARPAVEPAGTLRLNGPHAERPQAQKSMLRDPVFLAVVASASLVQASHVLYYGFSALAWRACPTSSPNVRTVGAGLKP